MNSLAHGIELPFSGLVQRNLVTGSSGSGVDVGSGVHYRENDIVGSSGPDVNGGLDMFSNSCSGMTFCP